MIVVDAGVLATALLDDHADGDCARQRLRGEVLSAPELIYPEVVSVVRRQLSAGKADLRRAQFALDDLEDAPIRIAAHLPLISRSWELRENVTPYDALYIALAEKLGCTLLTTDARLSRAPGLRCRCEVLGAAR